LASYGKPVVDWNSLLGYCSVVNIEKIMMKMRFVLENGGKIENKVDLPSNLKIIFKKLLYTMDCG